MNVISKMFEQPACTSVAPSKQNPVVEDVIAVSSAASIDTERTIWDPDYRR